MDINNINAELLIENLHLGLVVHAANTEILYANSIALELLGLNREQTVGKDAYDPQWHFVDEWNEPLEIRNYPVNRVCADKKPLVNQTIGIKDNSTANITWVLLNAYPELNQQADLEKIIVSFVDITEQKSAIPFEQIVSLANDAVVVTEAAQIDRPGPKIVYVNNAFTDITGYTPEEAIGKTPRILQGDDTSAAAKQAIRQALIEERPVRETILNYSKAGEKYWLDLNIIPLTNSNGSVSYFAAIERDITQLKNLESRLREDANRDPLTKILNRRGFSESCQTVLALAKRKQLNLSIIMLDIDHFKKINDSFGHDMGDKALCELAVILKNTLRDSDIIGRLGGEEFAICLPEIEIQKAYEVAEKLRRQVMDLKIPFDNEQALSFTISMGISESRWEHWQLDQLLKIADNKLYKAKNNGRNRVEL